GFLRHRAGDDQGLAAAGALDLLAGHLVTDLQRRLAPGAVQADGHGAPPAGGPRTGWWTARTGGTPRTAIILPVWPAWQGEGTRKAGTACGAVPGVRGVRAGAGVTGCVGDGVRIRQDNDRATRPHRLLNRPVLGHQARHPAEIARVARHHRRPKVQGGGGDLEVVTADV